MPFGQFMYIWLLELFVLQAKREAIATFT